MDPIDMTAFSRVEAMDTVLQVLHRTTGMRIALVAHVTDESWTACVVSDKADFGLKPGDTLPLHTTY